MRGRHLWPRCGKLCCTSNAKSREAEASPARTVSVFCLAFFFFFVEANTRNKNGVSIFQPPSWRMMPLSASTRTLLGTSSVGLSPFGPHRSPRGRHRCMVREQLRLSCAVTYLSEPWPGPVTPVGVDDTSLELWVQVTCSRRRRTGRKGRKLWTPIAPKVGHDDASGGENIKICSSFPKHPVQPPL